MTAGAVQWTDGLRALRCLRREPQATDYAFEVMTRLDPLMLVRLFERFKADPLGAPIWQARSSLPRRLCDRRYLAGLPDGSLGRAYLAFISAHGIDPAGLVELWRQRGQYPDDDPGLAWFLERHVMTHDLGHVITGSDTSTRGEVLMLCFNFGQEGGRATGIMALGGGLEHPSWWLDGIRAYRRGRGARWLPTLPLETLLELPLADVRHVAGLS